MTFKDRSRDVRTQKDELKDPETMNKDQVFDNPLLSSNLRTSSRLLFDDSEPAGTEFASKETVPLSGSEGLQGKEVLLGQDGNNLDKDLKPIGLKRRTSLTVVESTPGSVRVFSQDLDGPRKSIDSESLPLLPTGEERKSGDRLGEGDGNLSPSEVFWKGQPRVDVEISDLTMILPGGRAVMAGVNGRLQAGRLTAIMVGAVVLS